VQPWLISFGDMMTLFLCFFVMLVTLADRQDAGLVARGLGRFATALGQHGLGGALSDEQRLQAVNLYRARFGLPPEALPTLAEDREPTAELERVTALVQGTLGGHVRLEQPSVATFASDSAQLTASTRHYLDLLAETLRPSQGQLLVLEGRGSEADAPPASDRDANQAWLASARAAAVRQYLIDRHALVATRVEARGVLSPDRVRPHVDAKLVQPLREPQPKSPAK
jgi:chemotaxis protein MotB